MFSKANRCAVVVTVAVAVVAAHGSASALVQGSSLSSANSAGNKRGPVSSTTGTGAARSTSDLIAGAVAACEDAVGNALGPGDEEYVGDMGDIVDVLVVNFAVVEDIVGDTEEILVKPV